MIRFAMGFKGASILAGKRSSERGGPRADFDVPGGDVFRQRGLASDPAAAIPAAFVRTPTWHPFLYRKRIDRVEKGRPGDLVAVYGPNERVLGYGLYNPRSEIAIRMTFYGEELPDDAAWQKKLDEAVELRHDLLRLRDVTDAYRVIYAEADGLPGLVVDRLGDVLSAEAYTLGMYFQRAGSDSRPDWPRALGNEPRPSWRLRKLRSFSARKVTSRRDFRRPICRRK